MTTQTLTLAGFLLARIAEDEAPSKAVLAVIADPIGPAERAMHTDASKQLAECETKRVIVTLCSAENAPIDCAIVLLLMTLPYADHPDFRDEWAS